jgi:hypothetical protein
MFGLMTSSKITPHDGRKFRMLNVVDGPGGAAAKFL